MALEEIYIRSESETEARGPFNLEQLVSLADTGQVTAETLFYDATTEQWAAIGSNPDLMAQVFPQRKKLKIKSKAKLDLLNQENDSAAPITVDEMLAAAEGRTAETSGKQDPSIAMARAAGIGRWAIIVILLLAAAGEALPAVDAIMAVDYPKLLGYPLVVLGAFDLFGAGLPRCVRHVQPSLHAPHELSRTALTRRQRWNSVHAAAPTTSFFS